TFFFLAFMERSSPNDTRFPIKTEASRMSDLGSPAMQGAIVEVSSVEDAMGYPCGNEAKQRCCDCDAHVCESHGECCDSCDEVFCSTCLAFHQMAYHRKKPSTQSDRAVISCL